MKITKDRLLQIIREEVELHEKKWEESVYELDEKELNKMKAKHAQEVKHIEDMTSKYIRQFLIDHNCQNIFVSGIDLNNSFMAVCTI